MRVRDFDPADHLDDTATIAAYLDEALAHDDPQVLLQALADVARARGMTRMAEEAGLGRESLYKTLAPGAQPRFETVLRLIRALGVELHATPAASSH
jgi:probable addiction module antidote protein